MNWDMPKSPQQTEARAWVAAKFEGEAEKRETAPGLYVLANHDPVQLDARAGKALRIGDKVYKKGLYCHAISRILVKLPAAGKRFTAEAGLDHNDDTMRGKGSVEFSVQVGGTEAFHSQVMRYGTAAAPVAVDLGGATEFTLQIGDAGDGIGWDQSDWADAAVSLVNGERLWLSDLKLHDGPPPIPYDTDPPFSFECGGKPFSDLVKGRPVGRTREKIDAGRIRHTARYSDPETGLEATCVAVEYADFPTAEWTVYLRNNGSEDTPIVSNLQGIDTDLHRAGGEEFTLNHWNGSQAGPHDFEPFSTPLPPNAHVRLGTTGGRPTQGSMPYVNVRWQGEGRLVAIGWPGQWAADFQCDEGRGLRLRGGQELTHFTLHPGEQIRTPLVALQFTDGSLEGAQNVWRRWFLAYNTPHVDGKPLPAQHVACSSHQFNEMINADEQSQKQFIDGYFAHGFKLDYWWMDAGWYPNDGSWGFTGTWEPDRKRFPSGLRAVSDYAHKKGVKIIVWFEPERVHVGTWLELNHPEWMLSYDGKGGGDQRLLNLGDPRACAWLTDHVDKLIASEGIDFYRQDYNIDPLPYWRISDAPDRQGITENLYVQGYLAYWDGLLKAHPGMPIDTCSSGGRRLDLETLRRSVPLLRSDYIFEPVGQQGHTYGLSSWVPYQGSGHIDIDPYLLRSVMLSSINTCWDVRRNDLDYALARKLMLQWRSVAPCFLGDYYPLTNYSVAPDQWIGWQFDLPSEGRGAVQVFRHAGSPYESIRLKLHGLDERARYEVRDMDARRPDVVAGRDLMEQGLLVTLPKCPSAAMIVYSKTQ